MRKVVRRGARKEVVLYTIKNMKHPRDNYRFFNKTEADVVWKNIENKNDYRYEWCDKSYPDFSRGFRDYDLETITGEVNYIDGCSEN